MKLAMLLSTDSAPPVRRRGRPPVSADARERKRHIECAGLMLRSKWPVKKVARTLDISRATAYLWRDLALTYDEPEAAVLRRLRSN